MVVCVVFNPFTYDAQIIYVHDAIINTLTYAREIAKKVLEKEKFKGYKAICKVPNYSVNNIPTYVLFRIKGKIGIPVAVGDDVKRLFEVSPYVKVIVVPALTTAIRTPEEAIALLA
jgi:hypothetical protein